MPKTVAREVPRVARDMPRRARESSPSPVAVAAVVAAILAVGWLVTRKRHAEAAA
jgi:hypothetical protein